MNKLPFAAAASLILGIIMIFSTANSSQSDSWAMPVFIVGALLAVAGIGLGIAALTTRAKR